jgi:hypothetical protein
MRERKKAQSTPTEPFDLLSPLQLRKENTFIITQMAYTPRALLDLIIPLSSQIGNSKPGRSLLASVSTNRVREILRRRVLPPSLYGLRLEDFHFLSFLVGVEAHQAPQINVLPPALATRGRPRGRKMLLLSISLQPNAMIDDVPDQPRGGNTTPPSPFFFLAFG